MRKYSAWSVIGVLETISTWKERLRSAATGGLSMKFIGPRPPESGCELTVFSSRAARHAAEKTSSSQPILDDLDSKKLL